MRFQRPASTMRFQSAVPAVILSVRFVMPDTEEIIELWKVSLLD
jgi:hypothetical protein